MEVVKIAKKLIYCTMDCMKKHYTPEELTETPLTLNLKAHIIRDLKVMEKNTKMSMDELATKALMMFIATHNDYLGRTKVG